jgi:hypothetical protein
MACIGSLASNSFGASFGCGDGGPRNKNRCCWETQAVRPVWFMHRKQLQPAFYAIRPKESRLPLASI